MLIKNFIELGTTIKVEDFSRQMAKIYNVDSCAPELKLIVSRQAEVVLNGDRGESCHGAHIGT